MHLVCTWSCFVIVRLWSSISFRGYFAVAGVIIGLPCLWRIHEKYGYRYMCIFYQIYRDYFVNAPSQWGMTLHCNVFSHWLGAFTKWSLNIVVYTFGAYRTSTVVFDMVNCVCFSGGGAWCQRQMIPWLGGFLFPLTSLAGHWTN